MSIESDNASFGDAYIDSVAEEIQKAFPGIKGFNRRGLYRMKKFYETYKDDEFVTTLLSQISWSNHLAIISKAKSEEERHFYITLCAKENYSARELSRQIDSGYYERYMLSKEKYFKGKMVLLRCKYEQPNNRKNKTRTRDRLHQSYNSLKSCVQAAIYLQ